MRRSDIRIFSLAFISSVGFQTSTYHLSRLFYPLEEICIVLCVVEAVSLAVIPREMFTLSDRQHRVISAAFAQCREYACLVTNCVRQRDRVFWPAPNKPAIPSSPRTCITIVMERLALQLIQSRHSVLLQLQTEC
jgi:hypothetical protein